MDEITAEPQQGAQHEAPLFLLSFRQRDELAAAAAGAGWRVVAARRGEGVERRFLASGAAVAVIDARGALSDGLLAAKALGGLIETNGAAMLVLVSQSDTIHIREFFTAGATHFLSSPMSSAAIAQAVRFAHRHVERLAGWHGEATASAEPLGWRYDPEIRSLQLTPGLAAMLGLPEAPGIREALKGIDPSDRKLGRVAIRRLSEAKPSTAFAHDLAGAGRVVQHIQRDPRTGRLHALVEHLGAAPDAGAAVRDALTGARDAGSARRWLDRRLGEGAAVTAILIGLDSLRDGQHRVRPRGRGRIAARGFAARGGGGAGGLGQGRGDRADGRLRIPGGERRGRCGPDRDRRWAPRGGAGAAVRGGERHSAARRAAGERSERGR